MDEFITLAHGAGGRQTSDLIGGLFKKYFANENLTEDDAAVVKFPPADFNNGDSAAQGNADLVMTTDGFIVSPQEFNGGNIGKLSICGTVNDLACMGAKPLYLTCAFVIEEGFPFSKLEKIAEAMGKTAKEAGVQIIAGDTKVAGKGQVDGIFITTTGVGLRLNGVKTGGSLAKPGDAVIVTGNIGQHGCCILIERNEFGINADVKSDCAPLCNSVLGLLNDTKDVHVIRDATRGGVGTVLYEIAEQSKTGIKLLQDKVPVSPEVKGVCGMLGLEPLYLACEGRLVIFTPKENAENILASLKKQKYTEDSCIIGEVVSENPGRVIVETEIGSKTMLPPPGGELLPRIC